MTSLEKTQTIECISSVSAQVSEFREIELAREDDVGMIFISCEKIPELFIAVDSEDSVRNAIDRGLKNAFAHPGVDAQIFTNGSISGPKIRAVVKLSK